MRYYSVVHKPWDMWHVIIDDVGDSFANRSIQLLKENHIDSHIYFTNVAYGVAVERDVSNWIRFRDFIRYSSTDCRDATIDTAILSLIMVAEKKDQIKTDQTGQTGQTETGASANIVNTKNDDTKKEKETESVASVSSVAVATSTDDTKKDKKPESVASVAVVSCKDESKTSEIWPEKYEMMRKKYGSKPLFETTMSKDGKEITVTPSSEWPAHIKIENLLAGLNLFMSEVINTATTSTSTNTGVVVKKDEPKQRETTDLVVCKDGLPALPGWKKVLVATVHVNIGAVDFWRQILIPNAYGTLDAASVPHVVHFEKQYGKTVRIERQSAMCESAGFINNDTNFPVTVEFQFCSVFRPNAKYDEPTASFVVWHCPGRYVDSVLAENYVHKRFPETLHLQTGNSDINRLFQLINSRLEL
jgi:hypothetical protein